MPESFSANPLRRRLRRSLPMPSSELIFFLISIPDARVLCKGELHRSHQVFGSDTPFPRAGTLIPNSARWPLPDHRHHTGRQRRWRRIICSCMQIPFPSGGKSGGAPTARWNLHNIYLQNRQNFLPQFVYLAESPIYFSKSLTIFE